MHLDNAEGTDRHHADQAEFQCQLWTDGFRSMIPPNRLFGVLTPFQRIEDVAVTLNFGLFFFDSEFPSTERKNGLRLQGPPG